MPVRFQLSHRIEAIRTGLEPATDPVNLADLAVRSWDRHLLDLALTFGPGPSGPWRAEPSAPAPY
ncbi:hypothetical protein [Nocardia sp. NPDC004750]